MTGVFYVVEIILFSFYCRVIGISQQCTILMYNTFSEANKLFMKCCKQLNKSLIFAGDHICFRLSIFINTYATILKIMGGKQSLDSLYLSYLRERL